MDFKPLFSDIEVWVLGHLTEIIVSAIILICFLSVKK